MGLLDRLRGKQSPDPEMRVTAKLGTIERVSVVGESHYQEELRSITGAARGEEVGFDCFAELIPEPENPHDINAVMVQIDGQCVGYLSRANAVKYLPQIVSMMDVGQPMTCNAFIGCQSADSGNPNLGVSLQVSVER